MTPFAAVDGGKLMKTSKTFLALYRKGDVPIVVDVNEIIMDPCNRDGEGVKIDECLAKAEKIDGQGVVGYMSVCVCVQACVHAFALACLGGGSDGMPRDSCTYVSAMVHTSVCMYGLSVSPRICVCAWLCAVASQRCRVGAPMPTAVRGPTVTDRDQV